MDKRERLFSEIYDPSCDFYLDDRNQVRVSFACYAIDKFFPTASTEEKLKKFLLLFPCLRDDEIKLRRWADWGRLLPRKPD
jgi:hypothetical protein